MTVSAGVLSLSLAAALAIGPSISPAGPALAGQAVARPTPADIVAGRRLAETYCGMCHAIGGGGSPLPNAPPFRELWRRYPSGGLDEILTEGMLSPPMPLEEGAPRRHPAMPIVSLDGDQVAQLKAFLRALDRAGRGRRS